MSRVETVDGGRLAATVFLLCGVWDMSKGIWNLRVFVGPPDASGDFRVLDDGTIVDLIYDPKDPSKLNLLLWKNGNATIVHELKDRGRAIGTMMVAPEISSRKSEALTLPTGAESGSLAKDLIEDIAMTISRYVDIDERRLYLISYYVLYTWMQDLLPSATYLWLVGPLGSGKTVLLQVLSCLCRRAFLVGNIALASLCLLTDQLQPTIILDECHFGKSDGALLRFLRASSSHRVPAVSSKGELYRTFGAKVLASRQLPMDAALRSRAIFISMSPTIRDVLPFGSAEAASVKARFQNRLLGFRLEAYGKLPVPELPKTLDFAPRMRSIARSLALPVQADAGLVANLLDILREEDDAAKLERSVEPEWIAVEALFGLCHDRQRPLQNLSANIILVGGVTKRINEILERWEAGITYTPKAIGVVLRSIGIQPQRFGSQGYGVKLSAVFRRKVHELARQYCITRRDVTAYSAIEHGDAGRACPLCDKFGLTGGLRCIEPPKRKADSGPVRRSRPRSRGPLFAHQDPAEVNAPSAESATSHAPSPET